MLQLVVFLMIVVVIGVYYWHQSRDLVSPQKELLFAKLSLLALFAVFFMWQFTGPDFAYFVDSSPTHIQSIEDARLAIQKSNETIEKMANDLKVGSRLNWMFSFVLIALTLSSLLSVSEALAREAKEPRDDSSKLISIFEDDKQ